MSVCSLKQLKVTNAACSLAGRRALVVGGTNGIGMGIALRLAQAQASVTIVGRNEDKGREVVERMKEVAEKGDSSSPHFSFMKCDASLIRNVQSCANEFKANNEVLDILVMTQGIASMQGYTPTSEILSPLLTASPDGRVMSVLSAGVHSHYAKYESDPDLEKNFSIKNGADAAGFYNDIATDKLSKEINNVSFFHTAPGFVGSNWGSEFSWYLKGPIRLLQATFATTVQDCAEYHFFSLVNESFKGGGAYYMTPKAGQTKVTNLHNEAADRVWEHTQEVIQQRLE